LQSVRVKPTMLFNKVTILVDGPKKWIHREQYLYSSNYYDLEKKVEKCKALSVRIKPLYYQSSYDLVNTIASLESFRDHYTRGSTMLRIGTKSYTAMDDLYYEVMGQLSFCGERTDLNFDLLIRHYAIYRMYATVTRKPDSHLDYLLTETDVEKYATLDVGKFLKVISSFENFFNFYIQLDDNAREINGSIKLWMHVIHKCVKGTIMDGEYGVRDWSYLAPKVRMIQLSHNIANNQIYRVLKDDDTCTMLRKAGGFTDGWKDSFPLSDKHTNAYKWALEESQKVSPYIVSAISYADEYETYFKSHMQNAHVLQISTTANHPAPSPPLPDYYGNIEKRDMTTRIYPAECPIFPVRIDLLPKIRSTDPKQIELFKQKEDAIHYTMQQKRIVASAPVISTKSLACRYLNTQSKVFLKNVICTNDMINKMCDRLQDAAIEHKINRENLDMSKYSINQLCTVIKDLESDLYMADAQKNIIHKKLDEMEMVGNDAIDLKALHTKIAEEYLKISTDPKTRYQSPASPQNAMDKNKVDRGALVRMLAEVELKDVYTISSFQEEPGLFTIIKNSLDVVEPAPRPLFASTMLAPAESDPAEANLAPAEAKPEKEEVKPDARTSTASKMKPGIIILDGDALDVFAPDTRPLFSSAAITVDEAEPEKEEVNLAPAEAKPEKEVVTKPEKEKAESTVVEVNLAPAPEINIIDPRVPKMFHKEAGAIVRVVKKEEVKPEMKVTKPEKEVGAIVRMTKPEKEVGAIVRVVKPKTEVTKPEKEEVKPKYHLKKYTFEEAEAYIREANYLEEWIKVANAITRGEIDISKTYRSLNAKIFTHRWFIRTLESHRQCLINGDPDESVLYQWDIVADAIITGKLNLQ